MKGSNELRLNEATIIEAVQEYLDKRLPTTPVVVKSIDENNGGYNKTFIVKIEGEPAALQVVAART
jgi:hypothetical protein